jgi:hypothetical protein
MKASCIKQPIISDKLRQQTACEPHSSQKSPYRQHSLHEASQLHEMKYVK